VRGCAPSVTHHAAFVQMETQRQYNLAQRREDKKKVLARPVIVESYFGDDADATGIQGAGSSVPQTEQKREPGGALSPCGRGLRRLTSALVSRSWVRGSAPSVTHHAAFVQMETQRQYNLAQRREDKKKVSARPVIVESYFGDDADVMVNP
jgi:hypothetical protein